MTLQETLANQELAGLDLNKVAAIQQKRTLAFVNHFIITTVQFLNNFMKKCENRLMEFEYKLEKVEAAMVLLEARLSSIPEVNIEEKPQEAPSGPTISESEPTLSNSDKNEAVASKDKETDTVDTPQTESEPSHPEYNRFVKMVQVGVPLEAVKLKASLEGLDPNILAKILSK